jgi:hypothetical protein
VNVPEPLRKTPEKLFFFGVMIALVRDCRNVRAALFEIRISRSHLRLETCKTDFNMLGECEAKIQIRGWITANFLRTSVQKKYAVWASHPDRIC